ncbi:TOM1-like protein 2 [Acropora cervicornis]|uniref:TOM1-like protein 2 n=1 Tax=Acropora cervicornis TaxID=6130 RepID=A0AAD9Q9I7_ACRCE|nr:TOM1-like protein 2 [Acropora cervicornis]
MAALFGANPFSSPVGQRIEKATDGNLPSEDWAANIEICDVINESEEGPKDASKAIKKRLSGNKNFKSVLLTLTVLETCVKNCGHRFHAVVAKKDFLDELVKVLNPKVSPPQVVQEKILSLIQDWADAFRGSPDLCYVMETYETLRAQGIEFPAKNLDTLSPIYTPQRTQPERPTPPPPKQPPPPQTATVHPQTPQSRPVKAPVGPVVPTPEQMGKIRSELDIVNGNIAVMSEMLTEMTPGQEEAGLLLSINDDLNNVFIRYDRYERFRQNTVQQAVPSEAPPPEPPRPAAIAPMPGRQTTAWPENARPPPPIPAAQPATGPPIAAGAPVVAAPPAAVAGPGAAGSLISFDDELPASNQAPLVDNAASDQDDEFDMFAQSRKSTFDEVRESGSSYSDNLQPFDRSIANAMARNKTEAKVCISVLKKNRGKIYIPTRELVQRTRFGVYEISIETATRQNGGNLNPMDDIESWLNITESDVAEAAAAQEGETLSSSEFDKFLAERAEACGQRTGSVKSGANRPRQRQMQMENQADDEMFGL